MKTSATPARSDNYGRKPYHLRTYVPRTIQSTQRGRAHIGRETPRSSNRGPLGSGPRQALLKATRRAAPRPSRAMAHTLGALEPFAPAVRRIHAKSVPTHGRATWFPHRAKVARLYARWAPFSRSLMQMILAIKERSVQAMGKCQWSRRGTAPLSLENISCARAKL